MNLTCSHFCSVTSRNVVCSCRNGYILDKDNQTCIDYDECSGNLSHGCNGDTICKNIPGSYVCECPDGSKLENDERTCTSCVCSPGWSGVDCDHDVNECVNMTNACSSPNRECVNIFGSFACRCLSGFKDINRSCKQCTDNHFGLHCGEYCNCNAAHVEDINRMCGTVSGKCFCKTNWQGVTCEDDVNECEDQSNCGNLTNTVCHNIKGGYKCDCRRNYERNASNICNIKTATSNMTTGKPNGTKKVRARIILPNVNLPQGFNLYSASGFEEIANEIHRMLLAFYRKYIQDVIQIEITDIRRGSLIIDYNIIYNTTDEDLITDGLVTSAADIVNGAVALTFFGNDVNASAGNSDTLTLCALLVDLEGPCKSETECALQNGKPYCRKSPSKGSVRLIIIIAVTSSVGFLLIVVAAVCFCIIRRKATNAKKTRRKESHGALDKADNKEPHHACAS